MALLACSTCKPECYLACVTPPSNDVQERGKARALTALVHASLE